MAIKVEEIKTEEISELLKKQITDFEKKIDVSEIGSVTYVGDGIAKVQAHSLLQRRQLNAPLHPFLQVSEPY